MSDHQKMEELGVHLSRPEFRRQASIHIQNMLTDLACLNELDDDGYPNAIWHREVEREIRRLERFIWD